MKAKLAIVAVFLVALVVVVVFTLREREQGGAGKDPSAGAAAGSATLLASAKGKDPAAPAVTISMLYGTEKKDWVEDAAVSFAREHPEIRVTLIGKGSLEGEQAILDEKEKPTLFSPADSMIMNLLESDWQTKNKSNLVAPTGSEDAPQTLVITPLVFVAWEDRANALLKSGNTISWHTIHKAVQSPQGWPTVGGKADWGFVKLGHTDPTRSNSGVQALYLMSLEFYGKTGGLEVGDLLKPNYQSFVKDIEKGVQKFESSTGTFMTDMVRFGPSKYDISVVYENLAIAQIENAQGRWGNLKVYYPGITLWSDHPVALLQGDWVTSEQKQAARTWIAHLRSRAVQEKALAYGFRPGDPSVAIKTGDAQNPFTKMAPFGIRVDIPPVARAPEGTVVRNLLTFWTRSVGPR
ncbi:substrate-binding domain-containing protein [Pendulispora albinea]|uniref:Substrate-binding domain-containing protein n=1 Tax=Pendulispora albinea TaxID=2741071 RepID=A0ABZ2M5J5_9BACT